MSKSEIFTKKLLSETIFEKRDKERQLKQKYVTLKRLKNKNRTSINFSLQKKPDLTNFAFTLLSTTSSFLLKDINPHSTIRQDFWNKLFKEYNEKKSGLSTRIKFNKGLNSINNSDMFITEISKINNSKSMTSFNNINYSFFNYSNINNSKSIKRVLNINENTKISISKKFINSKNNISLLSFKNTKNQSAKNIKKIKNSFNSNNADILKYFQEQKKLIEKQNNIKTGTHKKINFSFAISNKNSQKYFKKLIETKTNKCKIRKDKASEYMDKLMEYKIMNYKNKMDRERNNYLMESYKNNIDYYEDLKHNIKKSEKLLNDKFISKLNDYLRFIYSQIETEKNKEIYLINKIFAYKNEIKQINYIIKKKLLEKNLFLKWIYFQIKVKEKILSIPSHYKDIIENKKEKIIKRDKVPNKMTRLTTRPHSKSFKKFNFEGFNRKSFKIKRMMNQSNKDLTVYKGLSNNFEKEKGINDEEVMKIKSYLKEPIFDSVKELEDSLEFFENEIIFKTQIYYNLKSQIFAEQKYYNKYKNELIKNKNTYEKLMKLKNKQLEDIKEITNNQRKENLGIILNAESSKNNIKEQNKIKKYKENLLLIKVTIIFEECKSLKLNIKSEKRILFGNSKYDPFVAEMLYKLKYITQFINALLTEIKYYKKHDAYKREIIKKMKIEIDKNRKFEKTMEQKLKEKEKSIKLLNKIEEKNNKLYFISYRKVDKYKTFVKKEKRKNSEKTKISFFNFNLI